jgi:hypothetical protein
MNKLLVDGGLNTQPKTDPKHFRQLFNSLQKKKLCKKSA